MKKVLLVNYSSAALGVYSPILAEHGIQAHSTETMPETLIMALPGGYSGIVINGDDFEYLPLLEVLRKLTPVPIGVAVSQYDKSEHDEAVKKGADLYRVRYDDPAQRVKNFSNAVKIYLEFNKWQEENSPVIAYYDIRIVPDTRSVLIQNEEIALGSVEFDILCYMIKNKERFLTYDQIIENVWGDEYAYGWCGMLWSQISRLRRKLRRDKNIPGYIHTKRGVGYKIDRKDVNS